MTDTPNPMIEGPAAGPAAPTPDQGALAALTALDRAVELLRAANDVLFERLPSQTGPDVPAALLGSASVLATELAKVVVSVAAHMNAGVPGPLRHRDGKDPVTTLLLARQGARVVVPWLSEAADGLAVAADHTRALATEPTAAP